MKSVIHWHSVPNRSQSDSILCITNYFIALPSWLGRDGLGYAMYKSILWSETISRELKECAVFSFTSICKLKHQLCGCYRSKKSPSQYFYYLAACPLTGLCLLKYWSTLCSQCIYTWQTHIVSFIHSSTYCMEWRRTLLPLPGFVHWLTEGSLGTHQDHASWWVHEQRSQKSWQTLLVLL